MASPKDIVTAALPNAKAYKLGRAMWMIADRAENRWLHDRPGNTAADAWARAARAVSA